MRHVQLPRAAAALGFSQTSTAQERTSKDSHDPVYLLYLFDKISLVSTYFMCFLKGNNGSNQLINLNTNKFRLFLMREFSSHL